MTSGRRRFDALSDAGYTESKINTRSRTPGLRTQSSDSIPDSAFGGTTDYLPDLYPEDPSRFEFFQTHSLDEAITNFYGDLAADEIRAKKKQINKWAKQTSTIMVACDSGRSLHRNLRESGTATVLPNEVEVEIVHWANSLRKDGASVSLLMLELEAKEIAVELYATRSNSEDKHAANTKLRHEFASCWAQQREQKRAKLQEEINRARKDLVQEETDTKVALLQAEFTDEPFTLKPPSRTNIVHWVSMCWSELRKQTIISGFAKVGIRNDTRTVSSVPEEQHIENAIVAVLERCNLADGQVDSDDYIGSGNDIDSDDD
ncbi:unnamed protein product [Phytophthora fragariaefolia]|uniref:Unnamed protein product n=1 Tax=Phytophthora fragariaefolia TaxID=1490495 RepID=A0A9W6U7T2_9STRA|nr:unnamed protein product [Phytophthora fragariaefolia]